MDREVVKELIQNEFTVENVSRELNRILKDPESVSSIKRDYDELMQKLQSGGNASEKAARIIQDFVLRSNARSVSR